MNMGIFRASLHFIKYEASGIGQLELVMWSDFVGLVRPANWMDPEELVPISALSSVSNLGQWWEWTELDLFPPPAQ